MESSRFPPSSDFQSWFNPLDPVMLAAAAAAGSACSPPSLLDSVSTSSSVSDSAASRFAPLVYQHLFHHLPPARNQQHLDLLTYHAAALHQHLTVAAAAAAAAASNRTFQQQLPSNIGSPTTNFTIGDGSVKKSACIGYSVADLLSDSQQVNNCDRTNNNNSSPDNSGDYFTAMIDLLEIYCQ